ncbi:MAG: hypothetical protein JNL11_02365 [Bdellovibrionaceae bacterium]|nr:hypothetical protein [Pseudobdellovibrionaceae bacterium]
MKGLQAIPSHFELVRTYNILQEQKLTEKNLLDCFQWVRFDPRLGEILVQKISNEWKSLNPFMIYQELQNKIWPSVMGVLMDFAECKITQKDKKYFKAWKMCVLHKLPKLDYQQFYIGLSAFAGKKVSSQIDHSNKIFKKWNFYGTHLMFNKEQMQSRQPVLQKSFLSKTQRLNLLNQWISKSKKEFSVSDYLAILPIPVSRRVAEMDLQKHPQLKRHGFTRGRSYSVRKFS